MYRRRARRDFLRLSKSKKRSAKAIRSAIRKQLQYIRRDVGYIVRFVQNGVKLTEKQKNRMNLVTTAYDTAASHVRERNPQHSPEDRQSGPALGAPHRLGKAPRQY